MDMLHPAGGDLLDVGANIGIMSTHLSSRFPTCKVHAIEPMPDNLEVLKRLVGARSNVRIYDNAVGDHAGQVTMILPLNGSTKMQGLSHIKTEEITEWNEGPEIEVPVKRLDEMFPAEKIQGIKMDVENYEYKALLGAENIFKQHQPILYVELWDNQNRKDCFDLLKQWKYTAHVVEQGSLVQFDPSLHQQQNFIFTPN